MKQILLAILCFTSVSLFSANERPLPPNVFSLSANSLAAVRERIAHADPALAPALAQLRSEADKLLKRKPWSVMDKARVPPSGNKHDYLSFAPYYWPDPKTSDGLPYVRRDGETNPESKTGTDSAAFEHLGEAIETLGLAYYLTGLEPYAEKAAQLAHTWFLDPATAMTPHLKYAQGVRGKNKGRGTGILDSRPLVNATDGMALLTGSPSWTPTDQKALLAWISTYYSWVTESKNGTLEAAAENNHGSWYDAQVIHFALVLGRNDDARQIASHAFERIATQIEPDGRQPLELARTKSFNYCCFNLEALLQLARVSRHVDIDLWSFSTPDGRNLTAALRFMAPYADAAKPWPKEDLKADARDRLLPLFAEAIQLTDDTAIHDTFQRFANEHHSHDRWHLLFNVP